MLRLGGRDNSVGFAAAASYATIPGGRENEARGIYSFAAGRRAKAANQGAFVWADSTDADFTSTAANQYLIRASGGVGIGTNVTPEMLTIAGNIAPSLSNQFSLGTSDLRWSALYLASKIHHSSDLEFVNGGNAGVVIGADGTLMATGGIKFADGSTQVSAAKIQGEASVKNLRVMRVTNSTADIDADSIQLDSLETITNVNLTADITVAGANGLDTGNEATGVWYHVWVLRVRAKITSHD